MGSTNIHFSAAWAMACFLAMSMPIWAQTDSEIAAILNPETSIEDLEVRLLPLNAQQLSGMADLWQERLQAKVQEISNTTLAAEPDAEALATLRAERNAMAERYRVVLDAWEVKGGDPAAHLQYVDAVSGLAVDLTDTDTGNWQVLVESATTWARSPEGGLKWVFNIVKFIVIVIAFWFVSLLLGNAAKKAMSMGRGSGTLLRDFIGKSVRRIVFVVGLVVGLSMLGIDIGPLLAAIGAAGFVVAFAMQDSLSNLASGIMILMYRPFDEGDYVEVAGVGGSVAALNLVSTTIKTPDNKLVLVPNNSVWGDVITNVTGSSTRRVDMIFGIGYGDDIEKAQKIMEDIVKNHESILDDPEPVIRVHELADSSVNFVCRPWVKTSDYWAVYWDLTQLVKEAFDKEGINIPFPQMDVHLHQDDAGKSA